LRPAWTNNSREPISKISRAKWTGSVAPDLECLSSNPSTTKKKKKMVLDPSMEYVYVYSFHVKK
jgi:hypothetical protein